MSTTCDSHPAPTSADQYLQLAHGSLRFRDEGTGPALVLLHGWTLDLEMWDPQVARLRADFRLIRFDRRGHGYSDGVPSLRADLADLTALCDRLHVGQFALLGMSQGARSALAFAARAPQRVTAIMLDGPPTLDAAAEDIPLTWFESLARERGLGGFRQEWLQHPLTRLHTADPTTQASLVGMVARFAGREFTAPVADDAAPAVPLKRLPMPALVLSGALDAATRLQSAERLAAALHAERALIADAGHLSNLDRPDAYTAACRRFLDRYTARRARPEES